MPSALKFSLRRARLDDLAKVAKLEKRIWGRMAAPRNRINRRFFLYPEGFLVAVAGHEIAGFCVGVRFDRDAREVEIDEGFPPEHVPTGRFYVLYGLSVNPIFRRRSVATRLVKRHVQRAARLRCVKIQLLANALSRPLFERLGFRAAKRLDHLFTEFADVMPEAVLMERAL